MFYVVGGRIRAVRFGKGETMKQTLFGFFATFLAVLFVTFLASAARAGTPTGASPNDALMVPTDWQIIAPSTALWFYFDYSVDGSPSVGPNLARDLVRAALPKSTSRWMRMASRQFNSPSIRQPSPKTGYAIQ